MADLAPIDEAVDKRLAVGRLAGVVLEVVGLVLVLARGEAVGPVVATGFLAAAVVEAAIVLVGLVVLAAGEELAPGRTEWRRAVPLIETVLFSLSDIEGRDLWVAVLGAVVPGAAGLLTVPAGGRVGGCLRPLAGLAAEPGVVVLDAIVPGAAGRRTPVVVEEAPTFAFGEAATLGGLEPFGALFLGLASGEADAPVAVVSSPERIDSSRFTISKPSDSDMVYKCFVLLSRCLLFLS